MTTIHYDTQRPLDLICLGRVAVDLYAEQIGKPLYEAETFSKYLGGCAGNIAVGSARLGLKSAMLSVVGGDDMGAFLRNTLTQEGVDTRLLQDTPDHLTGLVLLGVMPPDRFPLIFYRENCADMQLKKEDCKADIFEQSKALLITGTGLSTSSMLDVTLHALDLAKRLGVATILDIDYRPVLWQLADQGNGESRYCASSKVSAVYQQILAKLDLIVGTEEELLIAGGADNVESSLHHIREVTPAPIVVKRGEQGCSLYLDDIGQELKSQPYPTQVLNVLGAGDAFMSGLLSGVLQGSTWQECLQRANACGSIVVTRHGCAPAMPKRDELNAFLEEHKSIA